MPEAEFTFSRVNGLPVITVPHEIDAGNSARLREALRSCAAQGQATVVVDMSGTVFCDSSGLHQLVRAHRQAVAAGGEVRLVIGATPVLRVFAITGADRLFPVYACVAEAVAGPGAHPQATASRAYQEPASRAYQEPASRAYQEPASRAYREPVSRAHREG